MREEWRCDIVAPLFFLPLSLTSHTGVTYLLNLLLFASKAVPQAQLLFGLNMMPVWPKLNSRFSYIFFKENKLFFQNICSLVGFTGICNRRSSESRTKLVWVMPSRDGGRQLVKSLRTRKTKTKTITKTKVNRRMFREGVS